MTTISDYFDLCNLRSLFFSFFFNCLFSFWILDWLIKSSTGQLFLSLAANARSLSLVYARGVKPWIIRFVSCCSQTTHSQTTTHPNNYMSNHTHTWRQSHKQQQQQHNHLCCQRSALLPMPVRPTSPFLLILCYNSCNLQSSFYLASFKSR